MSLFGVGNVGGNASYLEIASQTRDKWKSASKNRDHRAAAFGKKGSPVAFAAKFTNVGCVSRQTYAD